MSSKKTAAKAALASMLALSIVPLVSCTQQEEVRCYGVSKKGPQDWVPATKGECEKLAYAVPKPMTSEELKTIKPYSTNTYVKCYGVAAGGKNDCATKSAACGGSVATPGVADAWVAIPEPLCLQVKNGVVGKTG